MARVLVDANVLIAARLARDQNHERAAELTTGFDEGDLPTAYVLTDVLEETLNYLLARGGHTVARDTLDALVESSGFDIQHSSKSEFEAARSLFRKYESLSLTDAVVVAAMERRDVEYLYSFDDGFDGVEGLTRLTTTDNPFS